MVESYQAAGVIQTMRGIRRRDEISWNLEHISHLIKAASSCPAWTSRCG